MARILKCISKQIQLGPCESVSALVTLTWTMAQCQHQNGNQIWSSLSDSMCLSSGNMWSSWSPKQRCQMSPAHTPPLASTAGPTLSLMASPMSNKDRSLWEQQHKTPVMCPAVVMFYRHQPGHWDSSQETHYVNWVILHKAQDSNYSLINHIHSSHLTGWVRPHYKRVWLWIEWIHSLHSHSAHTGKRVEEPQRPLTTSSIKHQLGAQQCTK